MEDQTIMVPTIETVEEDYWEPVVEDEDVEIEVPSEAITEEEVDVP